MKRVYELLLPYHRLGDQVDPQYPQRPEVILSEHAMLMYESARAASDLALILCRNFCRVVYADDWHVGVEVEEEVGTMLEEKGLAFPVQYDGTEAEASAEPPEPPEPPEPDYEPPEPDYEPPEAA